MSNEQQKKVTMTRRADSPRGPEHYLQVDNSSVKVDGVGVFGRLFSPFVQKASPIAHEVIDEAGRVCTRQQLFAYCTVALSSYENVMQYGS